MFGYQNNSGTCGCPCAPIVGVRFCGWAAGVGTAGDAWINVGKSEIPLQAYIDNVNAYDMSSIATGDMRLLQHDGGDTEGDYGTGALTGDFTDVLLAPQFFGTNSPCTTDGYTAYGVFDPFFQGAQTVAFGGPGPGINCANESSPHHCALVTSSFISVLYTPAPFEEVTIPHVVRCEVVYASSGGTGAAVDYDWSPAVFEPLDGGETGNVGICGDMPSYMTQLGCTPVTMATPTMNIPIPSADLSFPDILGAPTAPYFKATYWFLGDDCSDIP